MTTIQSLIVTCCCFVRPHDPGTSRLGFSGPSAHALTHAWYLGTLGDAWRGLTRVPADKANKHNGGIAAFFKLLFDVRRITALLPAELVADSDGLGLSRSSQQARAAVDAKKSPGERAAEAQRNGKILAKAHATMQRALPARYDDLDQYNLKREPVLMGNIGVRPKL